MIEPNRKIVRMTRTSLCLFFVLVSSPLAAAQTSQQTEFFEKQIRPVLATHCFNCHGPKKQQAGLRLDSREALLKGSDNGPVLNLNNPDKSLILQVVGYQGDVKMPPKSPLPAESVKAFRQWVA